MPLGVCTYDAINFGCASSPHDPGGVKEHIFGQLDFHSGSTSKSLLISTLK